MGQLDTQGAVFSARSARSNLLALLVAALGLVCSAAGAFVPALYGDVVRAGGMSEGLALGSVAQDLIMLPVSALLLASAIAFIIKKSAKVLVLNLGIVWCELYAFGLYAIQGQYTSIYILYLAVFSLSIFSLILGASALAAIGAEGASLPKSARIAIADFLSLIVLLMGAVWLGKLFPQSAAHARGETYGVLVMDLTFVFPAFAVIAAMLFRNRPFYILLAGVALAKTFMLCLSWGFGEFYVAIARGKGLDLGMALPSASFTAIAAILFVPYFKGLTVGAAARAGGAPPR